MPTKKLRVIPRPPAGDVSVLLPDFDGPVIRGTGPLNLACGGCKMILVEGVTSDQGLVIK